MLQCNKIDKLLHKEGGIMDKQEWKMFKKNCFDRVWFWATAVWVIKLLRFPLINFLQNIKYGDKIHRLLLQIRFFFKRKVIFGLFEYMVTTRCTLNCKECNTRIPKFSNETHTKVTSFEEFKKDIDTLLEATDYINMFGFVGGEPMLAKDLPKMIEYVLSKKQIKRVFLATNSTILPSEELLKVMKNKRFAVLLSDYSHVKNIKNGVTVKYHEHKKILEEHGVKYNKFHEEHDAHSWFSMPKVYKDVHKGKVAVLKSAKDEIGIIGEEMKVSNETKISINKATKEELEKLPAIGSVTSSKIISYRELNGYFKSIEDIKNVSGIGNTTFDKIKDLIIL